VVQALEAWKFRRGDMDVGYRTFDHQMESRLLVAGIHPKITDKRDYFDVKAELPKTPEDIARAFGSQADSVCKMDAV
jgi:branched-chain amino acid transport system substrate-binding protein